MFLNFVILALLLCSFYVIFYEIRNKVKNLPPGPFQWPLVGSLVFSFRNIKYPHRLLTELSKKYGSVIGVAFGVNYTVIISSFDTMKEVLSRQEAQARFEFSALDDRHFENSKQGIMVNSGESWKETRRYTMTTLKQFGFGKKELMNIILQDEVVDLVAIIRDQMVNDIWEVNPKVLSCNAANILWSLVTGYRLPKGDAKLFRAVSLNDSISHIFSPRNLYIAFPFIKTLFPFWSPHLKYKKTFDDNKQFLMELIEGVRIKRKQRQNPVAENFVEAFLDKIDQEENIKGSNFNEQNLVMVLVDLFFGGLETTGHTICWILLYISLYPTVQKKLYEEIRRVIGPIGSTPALEHGSSMSYAKATIYEGMRMGNVVPIPGIRLVTEDFKVQGYTIPKGAALTYNTDSVLMDKEYWGDPEIFRPERFLEVNSEYEGNGAQYQLVNTDRVAVFGFGRRACVGETLAWNTIFLFITTLIQTFEFSTISGMVPSTEPKFAFTVGPKKFALRVVPRK